METVNNDAKTVDGVPPVEGGKKNEPPEGSMRWNEIYGKMKTYEREIASRDEKDKKRDEELEIIKKHNKALSETIIGVESKFSELNKPDRYSDPEGYDTWLIEKAKRETLAEIKGKSQPVVDTPVMAGQMPAAELIVATKYDDYLDVIAEVKKDMMADSILRAEILRQPNPYKYAYDYGKKVRDKTVKDKNNLVDQGQLEGGSAPVNSKEIKLTDAEKRVAANLGISEDNYLKQKKYIQGVK